MLKPFKYYGTLLFIAIIFSPFILFFSCCYSSHMVLFFLGDAMI
jgi:hypothetical protein